MSSASIAKSTGKKKRRRCPSYTHVGAKIHPKNGAKRYRVRKKNEHHPVVTETMLLAPQESYVVQHTEGITVCLGGCMLPLLEVSRLQLGTLRRLQHELDTNVPLPVSLEDLFSSKCTPAQTPIGEDVLRRVDLIDDSLLAFQAAFKTGSYKLCKISKREIIRYANDICQCRPRIDRRDIMNAIYQRMRNCANKNAADDLETKLRDPCSKPFEAQRDECLKILKTIKHLLTDNNKMWVKVLQCEEALAI